MYVGRDEDVPVRLSDVSLERRKRQAEKRGGQFLRGPVPLTWLAGAGAMPGKALAIGVFLWWRAGIEKRRSGLQLNCRRLERFGVSRQACSRALSALERAGLVTVDRQSGKCPRVSIIADGGKP